MKKYSKDQFSNGLPSLDRAGFTMIEIAISLAIVAVAMVAILGILPAGLSVQQENREDTIIDQEAEYYMNVIRNSGMGVGPLFIGSHVEQISITRTNNLTGASFDVLYNQNSTTGLGFNWGSRQVVRKLLSTPSWDLGSLEFIPDAVFDPQTGINIEEQFIVKAAVKSITGTAVELTSTHNEGGFRYEMTVSLHPVITPALFSGYGIDAGPSQVFLNLQESGLPGQGELLRQAGLNANLWELELTMRWPLNYIDRQAGTYVLGNNKRTYRSVMAGHVAPDDRSRNLFVFRRGVFSTPKN